MKKIATTILLAPLLMNPLSSTIFPTISQDILIDTVESISQLNNEINNNFTNSAVLKNSLENIPDKDIFTESKFVFGEICEITNELALRLDAQIDKIATIIIMEI